MGELFRLLKKGNNSALLAAIVNAVIAIIKGVAFIFTGKIGFAKPCIAWRCGKPIFCVYWFGIEQKGANG